ncbi:MAG: cytoskeletal protein CcmA (bactofilin family) [Pseudorhodobacter sp.]|jgi:cytoskeletal protein CcmA (bactofilin family)
MSNQATSSDSATLPTRNAAAGGKSILASDLRITGDIVSQGSIEVMGEIEGSVTAVNLLVSHEGSAKGSIKAGTVDLRGTMEGNIESGNLTMRSAAKVTADVIYSTLSIESGAQVEGTFTHKKV